MRKSVLLGWSIRLATAGLGGGCGDNLEPPREELLPGPAEQGVPHDDFDRARPLTALAYVDAVSTTRATTAADDPDCAGNGASVWYRFTPEVDTVVTARTVGSDYDTTLSAYTGTRGALAQLACSDDSDGTLQSQIAFRATADTAYYLMAAAQGDGAGGALALSVDQIAPPVNDDILQATEAATLPFSERIDTRGATTALDDPACTGREATVWYRFTAAQDGRVTADTLGSDYDTTLSVYTGEPGQLLQLACNDDSERTLQSRADIRVTAGTTYYIMVATLEGQLGGALVLNVDVLLPPGNNDIDSATVLDRLPVDEIIDSRGATAVTEDPDCGGQGASVWYSFIAPKKMTITANTSLSTYKPTLSVYSGAPDQLTQIACVQGLKPELLVDLEAGQHYYVMIGSASEEEAGYVQLSMREVKLPANDDMENAMDIIELPFSHTVDTTDATIHDSDPVCSGRGASVWYRFTAPADMDVTADTLGSNYDTALSLYLGAPGQLDQLVCTDDFGGTYQASITFGAVEGTTYYLMASSFDWSSGGELIMNVVPAELGKP